MKSRSAGILAYRRRAAGVEVLLIHPGGPFWARRDVGAWQIPKGSIDAGEDERQTALREFSEETGFSVTASLQPLGTIRQSGGKQVVAFAADQDLDSAAITSAMVEIEWPPRSGRFLPFPEVDRARWFDLAEARKMILPSQTPPFTRGAMPRWGSVPPPAGRENSRTPRRSAPIWQS